MWMRWSACEIERNFSPEPQVDLTGMSTFVFGSHAGMTAYINRV